MQALVTGVCVDGGHQAGLNAEGIVEGLSQRSQAVGGAGCVRDDGHVVGVLLVVDTVNEGAVNFLTRSRNNDLLGACLDVSLGSLALGEEAGGLDNDIGA